VSATRISCHLNAPRAIVYRGADDHRSSIIAIAPHP
jgi:hypothetical protein